MRKEYFGIEFNSAIRVLIYVAIIVLEITFLGSILGLNPDGLTLIYYFGILLIILLLVAGIELDILHIFRKEREETRNFLKDLGVGLLGGLIVQISPHEFSGVHNIQSLIISLIILALKSSVIAILVLAGLILYLRTSEESNL